MVGVGGGSTASALNIGTAGQVLTVNPDASGHIYATPTGGGGGGDTSPITTKGQMVRGANDGSEEAFAIGTTGQAVIAQSNGLPDWGDVADGVDLQNQITQNNEQIRAIVSANDQVPGYDFSQLNSSSLDNNTSTWAGLGQIFSTGATYAITRDGKLYLVSPDSHQFVSQLTLPSIGTVIDIAVGTDYIFLLTDDRKVHRYDLNGTDIIYELELSTDSNARIRGISTNDTHLWYLRSTGVPPAVVHVLTRRNIEDDLTLSSPSDFPITASLREGHDFSNIAAIATGTKDVGNSTFETRIFVLYFRFVSSANHSELYADSFPVPSPQNSYPNERVIISRIFDDVLSATWGVGRRYLLRQYNLVFYTTAEGREIEYIRELIQRELADSQTFIEVSALPADPSSQSHEKKAQHFATA